MNNKTGPVFVATCAVVGLLTFFCWYTYSPPTAHIPEGRYQRFLRDMEVGESQQINRHVLSVDEKGGSWLYASERLGQLDEKDIVAKKYITVMRRADGFYVQLPNEGMWERGSKNDYAKYFPVKGFVE